MEKTEASLSTKTFTREELSYLEQSSGSNTEEADEQRQPGKNIQRGLACLLESMPLGHLWPSIWSRCTMVHR